MSEYEAMSKKLQTYRAVSIKTATAVVWFLYFFWPAALLGWTLTVVAFALSFYLTASISLSVLSVVLIPVLIWPAVFLVTIAFLRYLKPW